MGSATTTAPTGAGTYKASITLGEGTSAETASVEYTIGKANPQIGTVTASELSDSLNVPDVTLSRTDTSVEGTLALADNTTLQWGENTCEYVFTPTDTTNYNTVTGQVTVTVKDTVMPTGEISIKANKWSEFLSTVTFGWYKPTDKITITASDEVSGVKQISYFIYETTGTTGMTENDVK